MLILTSHGKNFFCNGQSNYQILTPNFQLFSKLASNFQLFTKLASNFQLFIKFASNFQLYYRI